MENASKALIMAAEILIGILLLSLGVYLFTTYSQTSREIHQNVEQQRLEQFNAQYTAYLHRTDLTIYDIKTIVNNIKANNNHYSENEEANYHINAKLNNMQVISGIGSANNKIQEKDESWFDKIIQYDLENMQADIDGKKILPQYTCTDVKFNDINHRVNEIIFKRN